MTNKEKKELLQIRYRALQQAVDIIEDEKRAVSKELINLEFEK